MIYPHQFNILWELSFGPRAASEIRGGPASLSATLRSLRRNGLIAPQNPDDRPYIWRITPKGEAVVRADEREVPDAES